MTGLRRALAILATVGLVTMAGCQLPPDTGATDPDRFVKETNPVWARPTLVMPLTEAMGDAGFPNAPLAGIDTAHYGPMEDGGHWLPAIPLSAVKQRYLRQRVDFETMEAPGTIVVDTKARFLYLVENDGKATRYGVGIGRQGLAWKGRGEIALKRKWPRWTPSHEMVQRQPATQPFGAKFGGLVGGLNNPLGARALYIHQQGKDTLYRVHGTPEWQSVSREVSSGCVRMFNQDIIDLFEKVRDGATIVVM